MGVIRNYVCQDCGNTWERMEGIGMMTAFYYCDKCGEEKEAEPQVKLSKEEKHCACGGTYRQNTKVAKCPACSSLNTKLDNDVIALWD